MRKNGLMKRGFAMLMAAVLMFGEMDVRALAEGEREAEMVEAETVQENIPETDIAAPYETHDLAEIEDADIGTVSSDNAIENSLGNQEYNDSEKAASASDTVSTYADGENIASGTYENITWVIDANGKLTVNGTGEFAADEPVKEKLNNTYYYYYRAPWNRFCNSILSAEVNVTGMKNASYMFSRCSNLKSINLQGFDTSTVTNMHSLFDECNNLTNVDLSGFNTLSDGTLWEAQTAR